MNEKKTAQGEEAGERKRPTRKRVWRWLGIGVLLLVLAGLVIPFIVRDVDRSPRTKETSDIKQLLLACRLYASDWDGKFPGTLKELYPDYIDIEDSFVASNSETGKFEPYIYFPGQTDPSFPRSPLVASPFFFDGQRAVGFTGGQVVEMREEEFQQLMNARKVRPAGAAVQE